MKKQTTESFCHVKINLELFTEESDKGISENTQRTVKCSVSKNEQKMHTIEYDKKHKSLVYLHLKV